MYYQIVYFTKTDRVGVRTASTLEQARKIANEIRKKDGYVVMGGIAIDGNKHSNVDI